jgi:hypothetical protein
MQRQLASALNVIAADQAVLRVTLQYFVLNVLAADRDAARKLMANMKNQVVESLRRVPLDKKDRGGEQAKQLQLTRAALLFQELEQAITKTE